MKHFLSAKWSRIGQFREAIRSAGLQPPDIIEADGKLHRFSSNGKRGDDAGWYVLHGDGIVAGAFGDWRTGVSQTWRADIGRALTDAEETEQRFRVEAMRRQGEAEKKRRRTEARQKASEIWKFAQPAPADHPYLVHKRVKPYSARIHADSLVIPLRDSGGEFHSLQFIDANGEKRFLLGGRVAGCYFSIGKVNETQSLCIAEGFATGATIHETTGCPVAVAFNAGNLEAVARALREKFPHLQLLLCADDDAETPGNPGLAKAKAAALAVGAKLAIPDFGANRLTEASDFNDLFQIHGGEAVKRQIVPRISARSVGRFLVLGSGQSQAASESVLAHAPGTGPDRLRRTG